MQDPVVISINGRNGLSDGNYNESVFHYTFPIVSCDAPQNELKTNENQRKDSRTSSSGAFSDKKEPHLFIGFIFVLNEVKIVSSENYFEATQPLLLLKISGERCVECHPQRAHMLSANAPGNTRHSHAIHNAFRFYLKKKRFFFIPDAVWGEPMRKINLQCLRT